MDTLAPFRRAEELEELLGDPWSTGSGFSFEHAVQEDESEAFPRRRLSLLGQFPLLEAFVPRAYGGRLQGLDEALWLVRCLARRDLTVAIALGQAFLGSVAIWLQGTPSQRARVASLLRDNRLMALALTERAHGSDLMASEVYAERTGSGFVLRGEKWLINNATEGAALTVFACTDPKRGLGGFSLFLLDKARVDEGRFKCLPKVRTLGIRGADISGFALDQLALGDDALIGEWGGGMDLTLKSLQVTRIGCSGFSLGALDTGLRIALDFARHRHLYGAPVFEILHAQATLTRAYVDLLICEALALFAARMVHRAPDHVALASAVVKYWVPTSAQRALDELAAVYGARYYLREGAASGVFQKVLRDHAVVPLFDGSTAVNLEGIAMHCLRAHPLSTPEDRAGFERLAPVFDLGAALGPPLEGCELVLTNSGADDVTQGLPAARAELERIRDRDGSAALARAADHARAVERILTEEHRSLSARAAQGRARLKRSLPLFEAAKRFCGAYAAALLVHAFVHGRGSGLTPLALEACLGRLLEQLIAGPGDWTEGEAYAHVRDALLAQHGRDELFSSHRTRLPSRRPQAPGL